MTAARTESRARPPLLAALLLVAACGGDGAEVPAVPQGVTPPPAATAPPAAVPGDTAAGAVPPAPGPPPPAGAAEPVAPDTSAAGVAALERASRAYESLQALRADFTMELHNPLLRRTTTSRGRLAQRAPDRILLRFTEPDGDVIVGDGTYFWVYYPSVSPDQVTRAAAAQAGSGGVDLRAQFVGDPAERFDWTLEGTDRVDGRSAHVLTLVPKETAGYRRLKVWIDDQDGLARRFEIEEHNGSTRSFVLSAVEKNPTLADSLFAFEPPAGVRIVEPPRTN